LQVHPNPFSPGATIAYTAVAGEHVRAAVYSAEGRLVTVLIDGAAVSTGRHEIVWNGRGSSHRSVASGVYLCRIKVGDNLETKKMILVE
jgi:flagellar hook assembly protein FlgD